ncbi:MAG: acyl-CoA desaturase [Bdellovibrionales bacterium]|nr:acyl-CoA desaturase [Bdellovibrionales bacterium]
MDYLLLCVLGLLGSYGLNILYVSVFYHRALTHRAVTIQPWLRKIVLETGNWVTGIDPKGWVCMHRLHHKYSDTNRDPHSPLTSGIWRVLPMQLHSYKRALRGLVVGDRKYTSMVPDLDFPVSWLNRRKVWYLPYVLHAFLAICVGVFFQAWLLAACYWLGMMSHPVQGWMVNALSHRYGYRNFATDDHSKNNLMVAWLVFGEGFQNNHHHNPTAANFAVKWWEIDLGYALTWTLIRLGLLQRASVAGFPKIGSWQ